MLRKCSDLCMYWCVSLHIIHWRVAPKGAPKKINNLMKKLILTALCILTALMASPTASALDPAACGKARGRFTNIGFVYDHITQSPLPRLHSDVGINFTKGNTYFLHKPIAGLLRFGIDAVWTDITYSNYKVHQIYDNADKNYDYDIHHVELGVQAGVSATVNLFKRLQAQAYFRYNPTFSAMLNDGELQAGYANMWVTGVSVTYGFFGFGVESRFGKTKCKSYFDINDVDDFEFEEEWTNPFTSGDKILTKFSGVRAFVQFRF